METHGLVLTGVHGLDKLFVFLGLIFSAKAMATHWIVVPRKERGQYRATLET